MQKLKSRCKNESIFVFQKKHLNLFSVLAVLMMGGIFLALSASAAEDWPFDVSESDQAALDSDMTVDAMAPAENQPPTVTELESDKSSPQEVGSTIKWTARAEDPEKEPLSYLFQVKGPYTQGAWKTMADWSSDKSFIWDTDSYPAGDYEIKVQVADQSMGEAEKIAYFRLAETEPSPQVIPEEVNVVPVAPTEQTSNPDQTPYQEPTIVPQEQAPQNQAPILSSLLPDIESPQQTGTTVAWTASAEDAESDPLEFQFSIDGNVAQDWSASPTWIWNADQAGMHTIEVKARDADHPQGTEPKSAGFEIVLPPNQPPTLSSLLPDIESPQQTGSTVAWTASAEDAESDPLEFQFSIDGNVAQDWSASPTWIWNADQAGTHNIEVKARDADHPQGTEPKSAGFEIVLPPNQAPTLSSLLPDIESPQQTGSTVAWTASAEDAESDPLEFQFSIDGNVAQDWSASPTWIWNADQAGTHNIEVKARDADHPQGTEPKSAGFEIVLPPNQAPTLSSLLPDKESPQQTGSTVTWTASAEDAESDPLEFQFAIDGNVAQDWSASPTWLWNADQAGTHNIEVKARDADHPQGTEPKSAGFEIVLPPNQPPTLSSLLPDKESPQQTGSTVTWTASAEDCRRAILLSSSSP